MATRHIADISKLCIDRHQDITKLVGVIGTFKQLVIQLVENLSILSSSWQKTFTTF